MHEVKDESRHGGAAVATPRTDKKPEQRTRARILLVDDDQIIVDSLSEFLRLEGYDVHSLVQY